MSDRDDSRNVTIKCLRMFLLNETETSLYDRQKPDNHTAHSFGLRRGAPIHEGNHSAMAALASAMQRSSGRSVSTNVFGRTIASNCDFSFRYKSKLRFFAGCSGVSVSLLRAVSSLQTHSRRRHGWPIASAYPVARFS